nr:LysM-like peptidoglycan-binding domain-containing protein [Vibrio sp. S11_S32]
MPKLHQRALMILIPMVLILLLLPVGKSTPKQESIVKAVTQPKRVAVPVMINGVETTASKPKPKTEDKQNEKRISLGGNTGDDAKAEQQAKREISNNAGPEPWHNYTVSKGDTLSQVFRNNDLSLSDLNKLVAIEGKDKPLSQIKHGQQVRFKLTNRGDLDILQIEREDGAVLFFRLASGGFSRTE